MKKVLLFTLLFSVASALYGQTFTSHGVTATAGNYTNTAAGTRDLSVQDDQSTYAHQNSRSGIIVAHWNFDDQGGTNSIDGIELDRILPRGAIMSVPAIVDVTEAITPTTASNSLYLSYESTTNVQYFVRSQGAGWTAGILYTNVYLAKNKLTNNASLRIRFLGSSATNGSLSVYIPYTLGNP